MSELNDFLSRLSDCDLIVMRIASSRFYCKFFMNGQYLDRMYVSNPRIVSELMQLSGEGEEVDASGVARLKETLLAA